MFAFMPPDELSGVLHSIREDFAQTFKFKKGLKPPVHITLLPPFRIPAKYAEAFEQYIASMQRWASTQSPFNIYLYNYNFFNNPEHPVVYVDVVNSLPVKKFHSYFIEQLNKYKPISNTTASFKPQVTIGYRDITPAAFPTIRSYYSNQTFNSSFTCNTFYLWKHNGTNWEVVKTYILDGKNEQLTLF
jgi:2'-5' RNA ligase